MLDEISLSSNDGKRQLSYFAEAIRYNNLYIKYPNH